MGRRRTPRRPDLDGTLIVDKPTGMTSHDVVDVVRRAAGQRKVGHTGTLDPDATGVLVCCLGRATRLVRFLQAGRKTYAATMVLGRETTTQDAAGEVVREVDASAIDEAAFCEALTRFRGPISQVPPMVSAVKVGGERLHEKARRGEVVERDPREVEVFDLVLDEYDRSDARHPTASFLVTCSAGTYVRTLAHDVGEALGVGGSLTALRRVANGGFTTDEAVPLDEVVTAGEQGRIPDLLRDLRDSVAGMPQVRVDDPDQVLALTQGKPFPAQGHDGPYAVVTDEHLVGIYVDRDGQGRPEAVLLRPEELDRRASEAPDAAGSASTRSEGPTA